MNGPAPLLDTRRAIAWTALAVTLTVAVVLLGNGLKGLPYTLGDTDDALRLTFVRELLAGRGWFDQHVTRLQPPVGTWMHWSRLVDGGIAGLDAVLSLFLPAKTAELATRAIWPLLWIYPAALATLAIARRLDPRAVYVAALLLAVNFELYSQFIPGRIDHHDIQIVCSLAALAGAMWSPDRRGAVVAGAATALGLAIGLEAAPFLVLIGASFALRYLLDAAFAPAARAYGLSLAGATLVLFVLQTPPARWTVTACDAIAFNLVTGVVVGGLALAAATLPAAARDLRRRAGALGLTALLAALAYLAPDRGCIAGPMAAVDPRLYPVWLNYIAEMASLPTYYGRDLKQALGLTAPIVLGAIALVWLARDPARRRDPVFLLPAACLVLAAAMTFAAIRASDYLFWFVVPLIALALTTIAARFSHRLVHTTVLALLVSPLAVAPVMAVAGQTKPNPNRVRVNTAKAACFAPGSYRRMATLPPGVVLGATDLGPFLLATTPHSALGAPYHRMTWGILTTYRLLGARDPEAEIRALHVRYVIACAGLTRDLDKKNLPADSLQKRLDRGAPPAWLERVSDPKEAIQIYRVLPPSSRSSGFNRVSSTAK
jgi:hypothetical protein